MRFSLAKPVVAAVVAILAAASFTACSGDPQFIQVTAGRDHTCALRSDGSVACWGSDEYGQLRAPENERFAAISAAGSYTCGLRSDGTASCWGYDLGVTEEWPEALRSTYRPPFPPPDERFAAIEAGGLLMCGLRADGSVTCWTSRSEYTPFGTQGIAKISAGGEGVCGLRMDRSTLCWPNSILFPPDEEAFVAISHGGVHACGLRSDGHIRCWGVDIAGQLSPPEDGPFSNITAGAYHTCALRLDGTAVCWGYDLDRLKEFSPTGVTELERQFDTGRKEPPENKRFAAIAAGTYHTCGLRLNGGVSCWGYVPNGQASPPEG